MDLKNRAESGLGQAERETSTNWALVDDALVALEKASVSVLDRGLLFGDSVYEVIPFYAGRAFRLAAHLQRLARSLAAIGIANPYPAAGWRRRIEQLVAANAGGDCSVYLQVTRGAPARREHRLPANTQPTVIAFCQPRLGPPASALRAGVAAVTRADTRWARCDIKSTALLANVLATADAHAADAAEAILVDADGNVTEGASSNVFAVAGGVVITPALGPAILPGVTRSAVLELARAEGVGAREVEALPLAELADADEIWLSSSTREILPVTRLDGAPVGAGAPGAVWAHLHAQLQSMRDD